MLFFVRSSASRALLIQKCKAENLKSNFGNVLKNVCYCYGREMMKRLQICVFSGILYELQ